MKHLQHLTLLFIVSLFSLAAQAQVTIPEDDLIGTWTYKLTEGANADITLTFKGDNSVHQNTAVNVAQIGGTINIDFDGTWVTAGDSITLNIDVNSAKVKYKGSNAQMGAMIEQQFNANREALMESMGSGGNVTVLRHVVVADQILCFDQEVPSPKGDGTKKEMKIVMNRKK